MTKKSWVRIRAEEYWTTMLSLDLGFGDFALHYLIDPKQPQIMPDLSQRLKWSFILFWTSMPPLYRILEMFDSDRPCQ
jgi:hypothetical protein